MESYLTYSSLVKLQPWFLNCCEIRAFGRTVALDSCACSEGPPLGQNTDDGGDEYEYVNR